MSTLKVYAEEAEGLWVHFGECEAPSACRCTRFKIRRPSTKEIRDLTRKHRKTRSWKTPGGQWQQIEETDDSFTEDWVKAFLLGWENVFDRQNQPVPFSTVAVVEVLKSGQVVDFLLEVLRASNLDAYLIEEASTKN
jgi:hypothetical protein